MEVTKLQCIDIGPSVYREALERQRELVRRVQEHPSEAYAIFTEHDPPVLTLGRRTKDENVVAPPEMLRRMGVDVVRIARGGDVTWHGPGQLVVYPILRVQTIRRPVHAYVASLQEAIAVTLASYGIEAFPREGFPGVWTDAGKIASIGVAVDRRVAWHGLALNVAPDMKGFDLIVPCGLPAVKMTSIGELVDPAPGMPEVASRLARELADRLGFDEVVFEVGTAP